MNEKISRREFLKKAGLVSAGAVMGNFILSPKSYARVKGANDRVNVAVVGFSTGSAVRCCPVLRITARN